MKPLTRSEFSIPSVFAIYAKGMAWAFLATVIASFAVGVVGGASGALPATIQVAACMVSIPLMFAIHIGYCIARRSTNEIALYTFAMISTYCVSNAIFWGLAVMAASRMGATS